MRRFLLLFVCLLAIVAVARPARAETGNQVNFFLGQKSLSNSDWDPLDKQGEFGAVMSFGAKDWPVLIAADALASGDEKTVGGVKFTGSTIELAAGVRKIWSIKNVRPYVGGGVAIIGAYAKADDGFQDVDANDSAVGPWVGGGVFWRLGRKFNIGFDLRWSSAKVDLDFGAGNVANDVKAGGFHAGMLLGFGW